MAAHLTDKQKKKIIADYVEMGSYNAVAKKHGVSLNTVKNIVSRNADIAEKCNRKKEQNTVDMLAYMDSRKQKAQDVLDAYLDALMDKDRIAMASLNQIATAFGIIVDKFTKAAEMNPSAALPDDGLIAALNQNAENLFDDGDDSGMLPSEPTETEAGA